MQQKHQRFYVTLDGENSRLVHKNGLRDHNPSIQLGNAESILTYFENTLVTLRNLKFDELSGFIDIPGHYDRIFVGNLELFNGEAYTNLHGWHTVSEWKGPGYSYRSDVITKVKVRDILKAPQDCPEWVKTINQIQGGRNNE